MQTSERQREAVDGPRGPERLQAGLRDAFFLPESMRPDLSLRSLSVLLSLGGAGMPRSIAVLAEELGLGAPLRRRQIATLERVGLVLRLGGGPRSRGAMVAATAEGARLVSEMAGIAPMQA